MKKSLSHLPELKQDEIAKIVEKIRGFHEPEMILLFGSYARGDWKDGPHTQGRGKLTIHKKSDYDILVITATEYTARDIDLWDKVKKELDKAGLSAHVRIIARDISFINDNLSQGQYFFTEIINDGIILHNSNNFKLAKKQKLNPEQQKQIAQKVLDAIFHKAKYFYRQFEYAINDNEYLHAAFNLHQAVEHSYKVVLLIFGSECPQEHHLDILGDLAVDYCPELKNLLPRTTDEEKELFELLDYAYIGARYDREYKITKEQLERLAPCVKMLHETTEKTCVAKINSFI